MAIPFRLYYMEGCKHCDKAIELLTLEQIPFQRVDITNDPIASKGIKAALDTEVIPVFIAFHTKELVKGFKADEYHRLITAYRSAGKSNMVIDAEPNTLSDTSAIPSEVV